jgi:uncharacterized protein YdhG (YjbR/CyaY superfamily)
MPARLQITSVEAYIAAQPSTAQRALERVRRTIRKALPASEETISYGMPTYKMHGRAVIYFAGWKTHYSLYPIGKHIVAALEDDLARYDVDKSTVRFSLSKPVPVTLIAKIAKLRARDLLRRGRVSL